MNVGVSPRPLNRLKVPPHGSTRNRALQVLALQIDSRGVVAVLADDDRPVAFATTAVVDDPARLAEALRAALPGLRSGKLQLAVAAPPAEARLRRIAVPPAPPEELPPLVRLQAAREAAADADDLVVDYLPPSADESGPLELLTAWTRADRITYWRQVAARLGGKLSVVTPRALAASPLVGAAVRSATTILATSAGDEVDIVALAAGAPIAARSAKLSGPGGAAAQREVRRTLLSLPAEAGAEPVVLSEWDSDQAAFGPRYPSDGVDAQLAASVRTAAAAWGLVVGSSDDAPAINLADPRRPPEKEDTRRRTGLLVAAAAVVLLAGAWMAYDRLASLDREITRLQADLRDAEQYAETFQPQRERVEAVDRWLESDVTWLDEIERLSVKLRPEPLDSKEFAADDDVRLTQLIATASADGAPGGRMQLRALARTASTRGLESRLRDDLRPVEPISTSEAEAEDAYRYEYSAVVRTPPAGAEAPPQHADAEGEADAEADSAAAQPADAEEDAT